MCFGHLIVVAQTPFTNLSLCFQKAMALRFAGFALTVGLAGAQLLPEQPVDFDELQRLMEKEGLTEGQDFAVPTNLSNPTICDSSVKQHSGRDLSPLAPRENWKLWD